MNRLPIIIDTDPGQDDAVALLLAAASPELELLGVTTVAGNVPLALTTLNARKVLELAGRADVPICAGADRPLDVPLVTAEHVHGDTGLNGVELPEPTLPVDPRHAVDFIVQTLREREPGVGEIKRMYTLPAARGRGHASQILEALVASARARGLERLILETGDRQAAALALYAGAGWTRCPCFAPYGVEPDSVCFERRLDA